MAKQIQPSKKYDSQQDDYVHNEKWSPDTCFTPACALCKQVIPYHDRWVYSALFNGWVHASLLSFKWPIFQNLKCIFFLNDMQDLRPCKNCHVLYQTEVKHQHHEHDELWYKKKKLMNYWTIILVLRKLWNYDTKECWWTTNQPFWSSYRHCR